MIKVLVIDDNKSDLKVVCNMLVEDDDIEAFFSTDPVEAIALAKSISPDVILLDISMPEMDGIELRRRLLREPETKNIPVIFLTSSIDMETELRSYKSGGCLMYMNKPAKRCELLKSIRANQAIKALTNALESIKHARWDAS